MADGSGLFVMGWMVTLFTHLEKPLEWVVKLDEMRFRVCGNYPHSNELGLQDRTTKWRNQQEVNRKVSSSNSLERGNFQRQGADNQKMYGNTQAHLENPQTSQRAFCRDFSLPWMAHQHQEKGANTFGSNLWLWDKLYFGI